MVWNENVDDGWGDDESDDELSDGDFEVEFLVVHGLLAHKAFFKAEGEDSEKDGEAEVEGVLEFLLFDFGEATVFSFAKDEGSEDWKQACDEYEESGYPVFPVVFLTQKKPAEEQVQGDVELEKVDQACDWDNVCRPEQKEDWKHVEECYENDDCESDFGGLFQLEVLVQFSLVLSEFDLWYCIVESYFE